MKHLRFFILILFLIRSFQSFSKQPEYEVNNSDYLNPLQSKAYQHFWSMEFDLARQELSKSKSPQDPYNFFVQSFGLAVELVLEGDKYKYFKHKSLENKWLDSLSRMKDSPQRQYAIASVKLHWALVKSVFGEGLSAAWNIRQAYQILGEVHKKYPDFKPVYVYYGVLNVALSSIPDSYQWAAQLTGLVGNQAKGLQLLEKAKDSDPNRYLESSVALLALKSHLEYPRKEILAIGELLSIKYKGFDVMTLIVSWIYNKNNHSKEANALLSLIKGNKGTALVAHTKGVACLQTLDYTKAKNEFLKFLRETKGNSLKKDTYYKLSQIAILENDTLNLSKFKEKMEKNGNDNLFADKFALLMLKYPHYPRQMLLAKLYCDGGLFEESIAAFKLFEPSRALHKAEKYFYMARSFENLNELQKAIHYYNECDKVCHSTFYIGPLACLRLANIANQRQDSKLIQSYLKRLDRYKNYDFKKSIDNRAKALK